MLRRSICRVILYYRSPFIIPAEIYTATVVHESVPLSACGIGTEGEAVGLIIERVHEQEEVIVLEEREIAAEAFYHIWTGRAVVVDNEEIQLLVIICHFHVGAHIGDARVHGEDHEKVGGGICIPPCLFVGNTVDLNGRSGLAHLQAILIVLLLCCRLYSEYAA